MSSIEPQRSQLHPSATDHTGGVYGRLTVLHHTDKRSGRHIVWACKCECGNTTLVAGKQLTTGKTRSCGCLHNETLATVNIRHGMHKSREYTSWRSMTERCLNPNQPKFKHYGGRGISIHPSWRDFTVFFKDMGERPANTTLDRIDVNGNYEPSNCRWATATEQANNKR